MSKKKPKIEHGTFSSDFYYSDDHSEVKEIGYNVAFKLKNVKADGADKFRILQDIKEAIDSVRKKYE